MNRLPEILKGRYATLHDWRAKKRRDVRAALKATNELRMGCALTPAYKEIAEAIKLLESAKQKMSVKEWGR